MDEVVTGERRAVVPPVEVLSAASAATVEGGRRIWLPPTDPGFGHPVDPIVGPALPLR